MSHVTCPRCGYTWRRRSTKRVAKCPNCGYTFRVDAANVPRIREAGGQRGASDSPAGFSLGGGGGGEQVVFFAVPESAWDEFERALRECTEGVAREFLRGRYGVEVEIPDEKLHDVLRCIDERLGVEFSSDLRRELEEGGRASKESNQA